MEKVYKEEDLALLKENKILGDYPNMKNSVINFKGSNNVAFFEEGVVLSNSNINFDGNNSLVYIGKSSYDCQINATVLNNSVFYVGRNNYFNGRLNCICSEQKHIFLGDNCLFSFGIWMRTADPHLVYSSLTHKRLNDSKSIFIGDSVWIGQQAVVLKGTRIGSGSIVGAASVVANKTIQSNQSVAGNPVRMIARDVFWDKKCVHAYTDCQTAEVEVNQSEEYIFSKDEKEYIPFDEVDRMFSEKISAEEKIRKITKMGGWKNRFAIVE